MNKSLSSKVKILDCTFRDGGYYNNWDFDKEFASNYLNTMSLSSVEYVEIGFRFLPKNKFLGPYAYTTDDFLSKIDLPENLTYGVMINGKEYIENNIPLCEFFSKKEDSKISLVRIAINFDGALSAKRLASELKDLGYIVGFNLMQSNGKTKEEYSDIAKEITSWDTVDVLYFADSLGNMYPNDVKRITESLKLSWKKDIGIHTHNNKSLALSNSLEAVESGVTWIDGTITGMGRGAGNVETENLLLEICNEHKNEESLKSLIRTVEDFNDLKRDYKWGPSIFYNYAATKNIHPTYTQNILNDDRYNDHDIVSTLKGLSKQKSSSYSEELLRKATYGSNNNVYGQFKTKNFLQDKEVVLLGAGPSVIRYKEPIEEYISRNKPYVISLNVHHHVDKKHINLICACHETRILAEQNLYKNFNCKLLTPFSKTQSLLNDTISDEFIVDYGLSIKQNSFNVFDNYCELESPLAVAYSLAFCMASGAKNVSLVGFDGYAHEDLRQSEVEAMLLRYYSNKEHIDICSLTPTSYNIRIGSLFL